MSCLCFLCDLFTQINQFNLLFCKDGFQFTFLLNDFGQNLFLEQPSLFVSSFLPNKIQYCEIMPKITRANILNGNNQFRLSKRNHNSSYQNRWNWQIWTLYVFTRVVDKENSSYCVDKI